MAGDDGLLPDEFVCACCQDLLVEPTTLTCGHTFCRACLAKWFIQSKAQQCLLCKQEWSGHPQVNYTLRSIISKQFARRYEARKSEIMESVSTRAELKKFEDTVKSQESNTKNIRMVIRNQGLTRGLVMGVGLALIGVVVLWIFQWFFQSPDPERLVLKPVTRWSVEEVAEWVGTLGPWASDLYVPLVFEKKIDGHLLTALSGNDLEPVLNMTSQLHQKAFSMSLENLRELGSKPPADMWEYKALHLWTCIWVASFLPLYPRLTIFFMYIFSYDDMFLPLVHQTSPVLENFTDINLYTTRFPHISLRQWIDFLPKLFLLPYFVIGRFAFSFIGHQTVTALAVVCSCTSQTYDESKMVVAIHNTPDHRHRKELIKRFIFGDLREKLVVHLVVWLVLYMFWSFIPSILVDVYFYLQIYSHPIKVINNLLVSMNGPARNR